MAGQHLQALIWGHRARPVGRRTAPYDAGADRTGGRPAASSWPWRPPVWSRDPALFSLP